MVYTCLHQTLLLLCPFRPIWPLETSHILLLISYNDGVYYLVYWGESWNTQWTGMGSLMFESLGKAEVYLTVHWDEVIFIGAGLQVHPGEDWVMNGYINFIQDGVELFFIMQSCWSLSIYMLEKMYKDVSYVFTTVRIYDTTPATLKLTARIRLAADSPSEWRFRLPVDSGSAQTKYQWWRDWWWKHESWFIDDFPRKLSCFAGDFNHCTVGWSEGIQNDGLQSL